MSKKTVKTVGEGGAHAHTLDLASRKTFNDGIHKHLFFINDRILMTDLSGAHEHNFDVNSGEVGPEIKLHEHFLQVRTTDGIQEFETEDVVPHTHELQTETTTLSGVHTHMVQIMGERWISMVPEDLISEVIRASQDIAAFKGLILKKADDGYPIEFDFNLIKKLNQSNFKHIVEQACVTSIIKRLTRLADGLRIEGLILSKERFADIGIATSFVLNNGLNINQSNVIPEQGVFTFQIMSRESFDESTLQRVRITEGVDAVVGFLRENDVEAQAEEGGTISADIDEMMNLGKETIEESSMDKLRSRLNGLTSLYKEEKVTTQKNEKGNEKKFQITFDITKTDEEKRLVTGPVLIPENIDLQDDIISEEEIRRTAHDYMVKLAFRDDPEFLAELGLNSRSERGFMHTEFSRKVSVVETYLAPVDFTMNGRMVKAGTWVMTMKVHDDEAMQLVLAGKITGFSIGGRSKSRIESAS